MWFLGRSESTEDKLCDENSAREEDLHYVHPRSHMFPDHA